MEKTDEIYLITVKNPLAKNTNDKLAIFDINNALAEYRKMLQQQQNNGYECIEQSYVTETQYIKTAKLTNKTGNTIRMRLENIPVFTSTSGLCSL